MAWNAPPDRLVRPRRGGDRPRRGIVTTALLVVLLLAGSASLLLMSSGSTRPWDPATGTTVMPPVAAFLLAVVVVVAAAQLGGALARRCGQPAVVGEISAGLLLGPTALGALHENLWHWLFPTDVLHVLEMTAQLGLVAFMFILGSELPFDRLRGSGTSVMSISLAGMLVPIGFALPVGYALHAHHGAGTPVLGFALFFALAISITALPVLARILHELQWSEHRLGTLALTSAAVGDLVAWTVLAFVLALIGLTAGAGALLTLSLIVGYILLMLVVVRPLVARLAHACDVGRVPERLLLPVLLVGAIGSAAGTEMIGVHAIIGAFFFGAVMPRRSSGVRRAAERTEGMVGAVLLPIFFAYLGLHTSLTALASGRLWLVLAGVLVLAISTKVAGVYAAARLNGVPGRPALSLGILLNCRGLTELVIADVGYQLGIIDTDLFTILVLMALFTTAITTPALRLTTTRRGRPARLDPRWS